MCMMRTAMILPAMLVLAGCNSEPEYKAENASVAEVTKATQEAVKIQPGKWETRAEILSVDGEGLPPSMLDAMKQASKGQTHETCVTPEMAAKPPQQLLGMAKSCKYENFEIAGGNMKASMVCSGDPANPSAGMRATMSGKFTSTSYDVTSETAVTMVAAAGSSGPTPKMTTKTRVTGRRTGECDATTKGQ
jgi:hypothetical protein